MRLNPRQLGWSLLASGGALLALEGALGFLAPAWVPSPGRGSVAAALLAAGVGILVAAANGFSTFDGRARWKWATAGFALLALAHLVVALGEGLDHGFSDPLLYLPHHRFHATGTYLGLLGLGMVVGPSFGRFRVPA